MVKNLPTMPETWVQFLGQEDLLEKQMATHSSIPAWKIPRTEEPEGLQSMGSGELGQDLTTKLSPFNLRAVQLRQKSPKVVRLENSSVIKKICSPYPKQKGGNSFTSNCLDVSMSQTALQEALLESATLNKVENAESEL